MSLQHYYDNYGGIRGSEYLDKVSDLEAADNVIETGDSRMIIFLLFPLPYLFLVHMA